MKKRKNFDNIVCRDTLLLERGKGMKNFKDRVELFWKLFLEEEVDLREGLGDKGSFQEARERIEEIIEKTFCTDRKSVV